MSLSRRAIWASKFVADGCALSAAFCLAFVARFEWSIPLPYVQVMVAYLPFVVAGKLVLLGASGQFKATWRYTGLRQAVRLVSWLLVGMLFPLLVWVCYLSPL